MKIFSKIIILFFAILLVGCNKTKNPLVGCWKETIESQANEDYQIKELRFDTDGFFAVTWYPFETFKDYWGTYLFSDNGLITLQVEDGNYVPEGLDLDGEIKMNDNGELILLDMYLGASPTDKRSNRLNDDYIFTKFSDSCE